MCTFLWPLLYVYNLDYSHDKNLIKLSKLFLTIIEYSGSRRRMWGWTRSRSPRSGTAGPPAARNATVSRGGIPNNINFFLIIFASSLNHHRSRYSIFFWSLRPRVGLPFLSHQTSRHGFLRHIRAHTHSQNKNKNTGQTGLIERKKEPRLKTRGRELNLTVLLLSLFWVAAGEALPFYTLFGGGTLPNTPPTTGRLIRHS